MNLKDQRFLVAGTGRSGVAAAELLKKKGASLRLYDGNTDLDVEAFYKKNPGLKDIPVLLGDLDKEVMESVDILVLSPGIPVDLPMVTSMKETGVSVWGEIELAYAFAKGKLLAVTGTNGKTTTVSLLGEILKNYSA